MRQDRSNPRSGVYEGDARDVPVMSSVAQFVDSDLPQPDKPVFRAQSLHDPLGDAADSAPREAHHAGRSRSIALYGVGGDIDQQALVVEFAASNRTCFIPRIFHSTFVRRMVGSGASIRHGCTTHPPEVRVPDFRALARPAPFSGSPTHIGGEERKLLSQWSGSGDNRIEF